MPAPLRSPASGGPSNDLLSAHGPVRVAGGHEEALPVDGRAGVAARVVADTYVALVQLHCDVVIVPVVQQDPVVLCGGDLRARALSLQPHPMQQQHGLVGGVSGAHSWKRDAVCTTVLLYLPR